MKSLLVFVVSVLILLPVCTAQESFMAAPGSAVEYCSNDVPQEIPDEQTITSTLTVSDAGEIADLNVKLNIEHMWLSDLIVDLIAPDGTRTELFSSVYRNEGEFNDTILDDEAAVSITNGSSPFSGAYKPEGNLSKFYGKSMTGTWKLEVSDTAASDSGSLNSWCLIIKQASTEPISAPIVRSEATVQGGICNKIVWEMSDYAQEYQSEVPTNIPDHGTRTLTQSVSDFGIIKDINVKVDITHTRTEDIDAFLIAPDGTRVELFTDVGGTSDDFHNTILDSEASQSITDGTGPFTGSYRPEGNLDTLVGKDIHGTWTLEITDNSWNITGTVESWSLIAELANVVFKAQCSTTSNFSNITAQSGWIMDNSYTFTGLDPNQAYWYRVKARPLETWFQTTKSDFEEDTLANTIATDEGDVALIVSNSSGPAGQVQAIDNPSFEQECCWMIGTNIPSIAAGGCPGDLWVSDGYYVACILFSDDYYYIQGDFCMFIQMVNWTDVDTLKFDFCTMFGSNIKGSVLIGEQEVWSKNASGATLDPQYNITVDVSDIKGDELLTLMAEVQRSGSYLAGILWDNLRTYRAGDDGGISGSVVSIPISISNDDTWDIMTFSATKPAETTITVDVLGQTGSNPVSGYRNLISGTDLSGLTRKTIRLKANLSSTNSSFAPLLHDWYVSYTNAALESNWSNVVSSNCN